MGWRTTALIIQEAGQLNDFVRLDAKVHFRRLQVAARVR